MGRVIRKLMVLVMLFLMAFPSPSNAAAADEFHAALTEADRDYRSASFYLRTGNPGLATLELQALSEKWQVLSKTYRDQPPGVYANDPAWAVTLGQINRRIVTALANAGAGKIKAASGQLEPIRAALADLRRRNGIFIFADCVEEANRAMDALYAYRHRPPNFDDQRDVDELLRRAAVTSHWYGRCFKMAPEEYKASTEFQRLMEVSLRSLGFIWDAAHKQQERRVINILRELRSSDRLLYLRFL
ncbi:MAG: hypothetical protein P8M79_07190 [Alphaproteobacteria bacterium]|nr:hypothetical protein [Alphaproteobacteria bacterium]